MNQPEATAAPTSATARLRHPPGLRTLFLTEMWERFSYYGMRGFLVLFLTAAVEKGGLGLNDKTATAIYGLYTSAVYLTTLPGGWIADRLLGAQRAVWYGGIIIALGHFSMALPWTRTFFLGMVLVVIGTGLLKANISAIVGALYTEGDARRDAGFSLYYMGINLGASFSPFICGTLSEKLNWHFGFGAAGVAMLFGLAQFRLTQHRLGDAGLRPGNTKRPGTLALVGLAAGMAALVLIVGLCLGGAIRVDAVALVDHAQQVIISIVGLYFAGIFLFGGLNAVERRRMTVIVIFFIAASLFWAGLEQAAAFFNLFAERHTVRTIKWLPEKLISLFSFGRHRAGDGVEVPTSWFQSLDPIFVITFAPVMAWLWLRLARKNREPGTPVKFGVALVLLAMGFAVMAWASVYVAAGRKVWPTWLITIYLFHTLGELCLSPVGLSSFTKLSPSRLVGQMLGIWFVASSLGNLLAGKLAGQFDENAIDRWPGQCLPMILIPAAFGLALVFLAKPIKRLMGGVS